MTLPDVDEVLGYFDTLSNWGRWGDQDRLGTLNFVTSEVTRAAAAVLLVGASPLRARPLRRGRRPARAILGRP